MGVETSPTFTIGGESAPANPEADLESSPLWPLQQDLRAILFSAMNGDALGPLQIAVLAGARNAIEADFARWRSFASLTKLRDAIEQLLDPSFLDVANDADLHALQTQLLASSHWNDTLPT